MFDKNFEITVAPGAITQAKSTFIYLNINRSLHPDNACIDETLTKTSRNIIAGALI